MQQRCGLSDRGAVTQIAMSTAMAIGSRAGWDQVRAACHADGTPLAVLFYATWHEPSMQMRVVVDELGAEHPSIRCVSVWVLLLLSYNGV